MARQAVPGPLARPGAGFGPAREARRAVPARPPAGRAWPGPVPGRPVPSRPVPLANYNHNPARKRKRAHGQRGHIARGSGRAGGVCRRNSCHVASRKQQPSDEVALLLAKLPILSSFFSKFKKKVLFFCFIRMWPLAQKLRQPTSSPRSMTSQVDFCSQLTGHEECHARKQNAWSLEGK